MGLQRLPLRPLVHALCGTAVQSVPAHLLQYTKVFNFKTARVDRQIGDRRGQNFVEGKLSNGP